MVWCCVRLEWIRLIKVKARCSRVLLGGDGMKRGGEEAS